MKLPTRIRYGVRLMLDLATHWGNGPIRLKDIAKRQEISKKYLEQLIIPLEAARLVRSVRGVHGGYFLTKSPAEIRLLEIIQSFGGPAIMIDCVEDADNCPRADLCAAREIWQRVAAEINQILESETLQDMVDRQVSLGGAI